MAGSRPRSRTCDAVKNASNRREPAWNELIGLLEGCKYTFGLQTVPMRFHTIAFAPGLSDLEVTTVEGRYGFRFPPDLREFLQTGVPVGPMFPDWRAHDAVLGDFFVASQDGILFDVEYNRFWHPEWGIRPTDMAESLSMAKRELARVPPLVPIFGHRLMPTLPHRPGNPVLSVVQTDIIVYGANLAEYLRVEFRLPDSGTRSLVRLDLPFWGELMQ